MRAGFLCPKCDNFICLHTRQDQNELHMKRWIFFAKISIFCKSIADPLPSVVQAYTEPYSFGGRIKLITCQIRHELSVTIHKIRSSCRKTLENGPYSFRLRKNNNKMEFFFRFFKILKTPYKNKTFPTMQHAYETYLFYFFLIFTHTYYFHENP